MAFQIPDAPNIVGGQQVLRQPQPLRPVSERVNARLDFGGVESLVKNAGTMLADYEQRKEDIFLGECKRRWTEEMNYKQARIKDRYKGLDANNDLYGTQLVPHSDKLVADIIGEPKDDGNIRIANPALQQKFKDWVDGQLPAYQSNMLNYSARELEQGNKSIIEARLNQANQLVADADILTSEQQLGVAYQAYRDIAAADNPGMDAQYINQQAAKYADAAVSAKLNALAKTSPKDALDWLVNNEPAQSALSSSSKAAIRANIIDGWKDVGSAERANSFFAGDDRYGKDYVDPSSIAVLLGTDDAYRIGSFIDEIEGEAKKKSSARETAMAGIRAQRQASQAADIVVNYNNPVEMMSTIQNIAVEDERQGVQLMEAETQYLDDANTMREFESSIFLSGLYEDEGWIENRADDIISEARSNIEKQLREERGDVVGGIGDRAFRKIVDEQVKKQMPRSVALQMARSDVEQRLSPAQIETLRKYDAMKERTTNALNSGAYMRMYKKATEGTYTGGFDEDMSELPMPMQANIYQTVAGVQRINAVYNDLPNLKGLVEKTESSWKTVDPAFAGRLRTQVAQDVSAYRSQHGGYPSEAELDTMVMQASRKVSKPQISDMLNSISAKGMQVLAAKDLDPVLQPTESVSALEKVDSLPQEFKIARAIAERKERKPFKGKLADYTYANRLTRADAQYDAIREVLDRKQRRVLDDQKEMFIQHLAEGGDISEITNYLEGMGVPLR